MSYRDKAVRKGHLRRSRIQLVTFTNNRIYMKVSLSSLLLPQNPWYVDLTQFVFLDTCQFGQSLIQSFGEQSTRKESLPLGFSLSQQEFAKYCFKKPVGWIVFHTNVYICIYLVVTREGQNRPSSQTVLRPCTIQLQHQAVSTC